ncbi:MAG: hypothetical protein JW700_02430 [Candidatus Aenigmarchaeota archaeon]|nr:hypothetical protein [Candidatus Aenigmarchaeota archaeon]
MESQKTPSVFCKKGLVPLTMFDVFAYKKIAQEPEMAKEIFGDYAPRVLEILNSDFSAKASGDTIGKTHYSILPDERGFCPFYIEKKNSCMISDERPKSCIT